MNNSEEGQVTRVQMPWPHMKIRLIRAKETFFVANRGGFKTSLGMAPYTEDCAYEFPRGSSVIVGPSYEHLYDNTLNALVKSLIDMGFEEDVHFVVRKKPPEDWPKPIIQIAAKKYDNLMTWHTGFTDHLISLQRMGSSNALSVICGKFDEAKLLDQGKLMNEVFPIFRPFKNMPEGWKSSSLFMSKFYATDKLESPNRINWILNKRDLNDPVRNEVIITLQLALNELSKAYNSAGINARKELRPQIKALEVRLSNLRKNSTLYMEANHEDTQVIQGKEWYDDKVATMKSYELKVAIHNEDPTRPEDGYYPDYDTDVHGYRGKKDYDSTKPIITALDYQHSVTPMPICQISVLPGKDKLSLNYIDEVYTLAPHGIDMAVQKFCDRYKYHAAKTIYFIYDQTATGKRNDNIELYKVVIKKLRQNGWRVIPVYTSAAPEQYQKYVDTQEWLKNEKGMTVDIRINLDTCIKLDRSLKSTEAVSENGKTKKQKKFENTIKYPLLDQSETTHFSDTFDMINHGVIKLKRIVSGNARGGSMSFR